CRQMLRETGRVSAVQVRLTPLRIPTLVKQNCTEGEDTQDIYAQIGEEISDRAMVPSEVLPEVFVQYLCAEQFSSIAEKGYNYLVKEWNACMV
ncbi:MAG: hypothetical protein IJI10_05495, partial [Eubacterium sp.]|nr:hypothetical protein [Eubacterium sp.]